jgi:2',3'-cyclic-nucleotide 2'-phosphodiesterase (5'-nucleotidase family)
MTRKLFLFLTILLSGLVSPSRAADPPQRLTILHSNDVHGHLRPFSYPENSSIRSGSVIAGGMQASSILGAFDLPARRDIGGIARRATIAARIRGDLAKQQTPVWMIDAGDIFYYSPFSTEYHGDADVLAMNQAGYDFATLGNHEFEITLAQLKKMIADARFHFLCANVTDTATRQPLMKRDEVRQVGAARVGIFGLVTNSSHSLAASGGLEFEDDSAAAASVVAELRGPMKADIVVLISHLGDAEDKKLALKVPGIDVIVGAHWHTRLPQGQFVPWSDELKPDEVNGTIVVQAGQWGGELGRLDLLLQKNTAGRWRVNRYHESLIPVTSETPEDPGVNAVLDKLWAPIAAKYDEVLATATADFAERGDDLSQTNLYADLVRAEFGVDVEFEGTGGVHWPLVSGSVTRGALVDLDQNQSTVVTFRMKGSEIRRFVQRSTPIGSGLRYRMFRGKLDAITVGDAPLDDARVYSCAASSSMAGRMNGFEVLDRTDTKKPWSGVVIGAIRKARTITPAYDGRRIVVDNPRSGDR